MKIQVREADYTKLYKSYELVAYANRYAGPNGMLGKFRKKILIKAAQLHREHYEDNYGKT